MTKKELIENSIETSELLLTQKDATTYFNAIVTTMNKSIKKDKRLAIPDFGVFTVVKRKARAGRNPQTGAKIRIKASKSVKFKPGPTLKKSL